MRHEQFKPKTESQVVAGCLFFPLAPVLLVVVVLWLVFFLVVHRLPAHRHLDLVVHSRSRHPLCLLRQPHLARLHRAARFASPRRARWFSIGHSARVGVSRWRGWHFTTSLVGESSIRSRWSFVHSAAHARFGFGSRSEISSTDTQRHSTGWRRVLWIDWSYRHDPSA